MTVNKHSSKTSSQTAAPAHQDGLETDGFVLYYKSQKTTRFLEACRHGKLEPHSELPRTTLQVLPSI